MLVILIERKKTTCIQVILAMVVVTLIFPFLVTAKTGSVTRLAGYDRYETATQIAKAGWVQSDYAVLAYGENYPDALASTPLACRYDAPILLTTSDRLPETTRLTLLDLKVKNVIIVGGTGVIFSAVDAELQEMGLNVNRVYGYDKYETAVEIAQELNDPEEVFVVIGEDFQNALSVASIAGIKQIPVLLVPQGAVPNAVKNYVATQSISKSYVVGNTDVISDQVCNQFPNVERIFGATKYQTNLIINRTFMSANFFQSDNICLATGEIFADALAGSAYAAKLSAPIILINDNPITETNEYVKNKAAENHYFFVFGGTGIIPERVIRDMILNDISSEPDDE